MLSAGNHKMADTKLKTYNIGIIGIGYWGPNWVRVVNEHPKCRITWISDILESNFDKITSAGSDVTFTTDYHDMLKDHPKNGKRPDAVVIATPASTHYNIAKEVLEAGIHVLVEKPLAIDTAHCKELTAIAKAKGVTLMVGHTFLYNAGISYAKNVMDGKIGTHNLGKIQDIQAERMSLGPIRNDVNAIWDFASHDIYILNHLIGQKPVSVSCQAGHIPEGRKNLETVGVIHLFYPNNVMGRITVSSIWPEKVRRVMIVGDKAALHFDDVAADKKVTIYQKGVNYNPTTQSHAQHQAMVTDGDIFMPKIAYNEPLKEEFNHFIDCFENKKTPISDGEQGHDVVKILHAATKSLRERDGGKVPLEWR